MTSHDQTSKNNLRQVLAFFVEEKAFGIDASVKIVPIRQKQIEEPLKQRFRELDVPMLTD